MWFPSFSLFCDLIFYPTAASLALKLSVVSISVEDVQYVAAQPVKQKVSLPFSHKHPHTHKASTNRLLSIIIIIKKG